MTSQPTEYKLYAKRYFIATVFGLSNFINASMVTSFTAITPTSSLYYQTSEFWVSCFVLVTNAMYLVMGPASAWIIDNLGLHSSLLWGMTFTVLGAVLRLVADFVDNKFPIVMAAQTLIAIGQPMCLSPVGKASGHWFPPDSRTMSTAAMSIGNTLGAILSFVLGPMIVTSPSQQLYITYNVIMLVLCVVVWIPCFWVESEPPTPCSPSSKMDTNEKNQFWAGVMCLCKDKHYLILWLVCATITGMLNTLSVFVSQLATSAGYSELDSGTFGAITVVSGLVSVFSLSYMADKRQNHEFIMKLCCFVATLGIVFIYFGMMPGAYAIMAIGCGILGIGGMPAIPFSMELGIEASFGTTPEGTSTSFMILGQNVLTVLFVLVSQALKQDENFKRSVVFWAVLLFLASLLALFFKNEKVRYQQDTLKETGITE